MIKNCNKIFLLTCRLSPAGWPAAQWPAPWRCSTSSQREGLPPGISCFCFFQPEEWRPVDPPRWWFGTECGGAPHPQRKCPVDNLFIKIYRQIKNPYWSSIKIKNYVYTADHHQMIWLFYHLCLGILSTYDCIKDKTMMELVMLNLSFLPLDFMYINPPFLLLFIWPLLLTSIYMFVTYSLFEVLLLFWELTTR